MKKLVMIAIRGYQRLKPILDQIILTVFGTTHRCRFQPSCSEYTLQMIERHGIIIGLQKGLGQLKRCW